MATLLSVTNNVLRRLRSDTVTDTTLTDYSTLVADLVRDAYEQVAEEHDWSNLYHNVTVAITAGQSTYNLSSFVATGGDVADTDARVCKTDSVLEYDSSHDRPSAKLYDDTSDDSGLQMYPLSRADFEAYKALDRDSTDDDPVYFTLYVDEATGEELTLEVYPEPAQARTARFRFWTKPDELALDGTDDATVLRVPSRPVFALALMYAYIERGEELGEPTTVSEQRYASALSLAKLKDMHHGIRSNSYDWRRD